MTDQPYAGDLMPRDAFEILKNDPDAVLIDVRTDAEWNWVGVPDLSAIGKQVEFVPWVIFPTMQPNPDFVHQATSGRAKKDAPVIFLCRSGVRSKGAAIAVTAAGYAKCYNLAHGFEGDPDGEKHRGTTNGWKVDGLPWVQG